METKTNSTSESKVSKSTNGNQQTKMDKARKIFKEMYGKEGVERKHVIQRFMKELPMSKFGSSTYYSNCVSEHRRGKL